MPGPRNELRSRRFTVALLAACAAATFAACDLDVTNPGAIENSVLNDTTYIDLMLNGVLGDFQPAYAWTALFSASFTDELRNHHGYFENIEIDQRSVGAGNATYALSVYNGLHRVRSLAERTEQRMRDLLGEPAEQDVRLAQVIAYGGYAYLLLGEQLCTTPVEEGAALGSDALLETAVTRLEEAITVAQAAAAATDSAALQAVADSFINFARVGAARAALDLGNTDAAIQYASAVAPAYESRDAEGFEFRTHYLDQPTTGARRRTGNPYWEFLRVERWWSLTGTPFDNLNDPRVPYDPEGVPVFGGTLQHSPNSPPSFSTYDGSAGGALFEATASIRIASALEARYVIAEAEGLNAANLDFVNQRRAIGGQAALPAGASAEAYMDALRNQRRRDFYLDGHRMGDLRRYEKLYQLDLWQTGPFPGSDTESYGTQKCWPVPNSEASAG